MLGVLNSLPHLIFTVAHYISSVLQIGILRLSQNLLSYSEQSQRLLLIMAIALYNKLSETVITSVFPIYVHMDINRGLQKMNFGFCKLMRL